MALFEIKHRHSGSVLFKLETESLKLCVEAAVKSRANLDGANLGGNKLIGDRPIIQISPIGSRGDCLTAFITDNGLFLRAGCFFGTVEKFKEAVKNTHGGNAHAEEYMAAIALIETHARIYTPKAEGE